ncbi:MAG: nucleotide-binding protein [Treponema sp.]|nr:nucleotide-binding protein [Treponema sp.]
MSNVFIGWSGNKSLADKVADLITEKTGDHVIVGGGLPKDMFIGAQVIDQINRCDTAILLVEDKNGMISSNLMFEWGYIYAKFAISNVHAFLLNKQSKDLPSDLMGSWVTEVSFNKASTSEQELSERILDLYLQNSKNRTVRNYFDLISDWKKVFTYLTDKTSNSNQALCEYILAGCLAAYYYQDNMILRQTLNNLKVPLPVNIIVQFAKAYIDIFIQSENMSKPLSQQDYFSIMQVFETIIKRQKHFSNDVETLLDILNYDAYSLANVLFMKNDNLDEETKKFCSNKAKECLEKDFELLDSFEETYKNNECLVLLLRSYIFNDIGHLYKDAFNDESSFLEKLTESVEYRKQLHQCFISNYPANIFLATKLEQEYIIALSEQCNYMENSVLKTMYKNLVITKFEEWEKELVYTSSLTDRIKNNIQNFE